MRIVSLLCLLGAAGLWGWAFWGPKALPALPSRYVGVYRQTGFEPPIATNGRRVPMANPYPKGQRRRFTLNADGTYTLSVRVSGDYEMMRQDGTVRYFEETGILEMVQLSENLQKLEESSTFRYRPRWGQDKEGRFLQLIAEVTEKQKGRFKQGHEIYLRPSSESPGSN